MDAQPISFQLWVTNSMPLKKPLSDRNGIGFRPIAVSTELIAPASENREIRIAETTTHIVGIVETLMKQSEKSGV